MRVEQHLGQHMRAGQRELQRLRGQRPGARKGGRQIERARADRAFDHRRRSGAEVMRLRLLEGEPFGEPDLAPHAGHWPHEILDHAVSLGVIDVEAIKLAVADQIDAGHLLGVDDDPRGVDQRLLGRQRDEPVRHRIGADGRGLDTMSHRCITPGLAVVSGLMVRGQAAALACFEAIAAPSTSASNFAQTILSWISSLPAKLAKPQSVPAMTRSRPKASIQRPSRCAMSSGCSTITFDCVIMPGIMRTSSGSLASRQAAHSCSWRGLAASNENAPALSRPRMSRMYLTSMSCTRGPKLMP